MLINHKLFDELEDAWLGINKKDVKQATYKNPLQLRPEWIDNPGLAPLALMKNPEYIIYACKRLLNYEAVPYQAVVLYEMMTHPFPMVLGSRGMAKSTLLAVYAMLKLATTPRNKAGQPGARIVIVGAGFRQSKQIFEYMENIWYNSPFLRSISGGNKRMGPTYEMDRHIMRIGPNVASAIPLGDGSKIRGLRANIVMADEFASIDPEIFEEVVQGFASVSSNMIDNVKRRAKYYMAQKLGINIIEPAYQKNQIIISGTASYDFEPFADYWKKYKAIIESGGEAEKLSQYFPHGTPDNFNHKDYCIIRIPYDKLPAGYLDENIIARAQATIHTGTFQKEYGAVFTKDSTGFYPRTLIEGCVANGKNISKPNWVGWCPNVFDPTINGNKDKQYVLACDPASEKDNFAIVIVELCDNHARVVYCMTTRKDKHRELVKRNLVLEHDFYEYACRRIRELMKRFNISRIMLDSQGGGVAVTEALHNKRFLEPGESLIWPVKDPDKMGDFDAEPGLHILELINFADAKWTAEANHGLKFDMETRKLLFPQFDNVSLDIASAFDRQRIHEFKKQYPGFEIYPYDTHEDCTFEIEELKDELTSIIYTKTGFGNNARDRWDTPEVKGPTGKKGRLCKDRYSALLMANMGARKLRAEQPAAPSTNIGGLLMSTPSKPGQLYTYVQDDSKMADFLKFYGVL